MKGVELSGIGQSVRRVLDAYAKRLRTNNPRTNVLLMRKRELRRHGEEGRRVVMKAFVRASAQCFAEGNLREARRFYDGAFEFGTKNQIRGHLLGICISAASGAFRTGDHDAVWNLLAAARTYCPEPLGPGTVDERFASRGVVFSELRLPTQLEPLQRLQSVRHLLPAPATAVA